MRFGISLLLLRIARYKWIHIDASHVCCTFIRGHFCVRYNDVTVFISRHFISGMKIHHVIKCIEVIFKYYLSIFKAPSPPQSYLVTSSSTSTVNYFQQNSTSQNAIDILACEDDDLGGPNCPSLTGPIAVYRFSFAMVLFFSSLMVLTLGVSTSKSFRAKIHNGFWLWKFLYAFFLISVSFKLPFFKFGIIKTGKSDYSILNREMLLWPKSIIDR